MDGRSLWPILRDAGVFWGRDILLEGPGLDPDALAVTALHTPRWAYSEYLGGDLYDLANDPHELRSITMRRRAPRPAATSRDDSLRFGAAPAPTAGGERRCCSRNARAARAGWMSSFAVQMPGVSHASVSSRADRKSPRSRRSRTVRPCY